MQKQFYTKKDFVGIINLLIVWREVVTSRCHGSEPWSCRYGRKKKKKKKKKEKIYMYDFLVLYGAKKQNGSPYFSSVVRQYKWPSLSKRIVKIHKFCCNLTRAG